MAGGALLNMNPGMIVSPAVPQTDNAVAWNFERFDGLDVPTDHPAGGDPGRGSAPTTTDYGWNLAGHSPRPGGAGTPVADQVYTPGPLKGVVGTVGGQPLPVSDRLHRAPGTYTPGKTHSVQQRLGVGQSYQGAAQTVQLSEITNNPPVPGDLGSIIAGIA
jgi:hypothetical protein